MWAALGLALGLSAAPALEAEEALRLYNAASERPLPALSKRELRLLREGKVVRRYTHPKKAGDGAGVLGLVVAEVPREELWLTIRDGHLSVTEGLIERHISGRYDQPDQVWFGMFDLPAAFRARHWRIHTRTEVALAKRSGGLAWESTWARVDDGAALNARDAAAGKLAGITPENLARAIYVVENHGSWLTLELGPRRTLLVYRATADLGGVIPREVVAAFAHARLKKLLTETVAEVAAARGHYVGAHEPIASGDGLPLPPYPRR